MTDTPKSAPATPAATPMAALPAKWRKECPHGAIGPYSQGLMDCAEELETAQPAPAQPQRESEVQSIFTVEQVRDALIASSPQGFDLSKCGVNEHILVDELNERLPLAAQRESEQPEQALRKAATRLLNLVWEENLEHETESEFERAVVALRAALPPQTDSQETP